MDSAAFSKISKPTVHYVIDWYNIYKQTKGQFDLWGTSGSQTFYYIKLMNISALCLFSVSILFIGVYPAQIHYDNLC